MISPEDLHKDFNKIPVDFSVSFKFTDFCKDRKDSEGNDIQRCKSQETELEDLCSKCKNIMQDEV